MHLNSFKTFLSLTLIIMSPIRHLDKAVDSKELEAVVVSNPGQTTINNLSANCVYSSMDGSSTFTIDIDATNVSQAGASIDLLFNGALISSSTVGGAGAIVFSAIAVTEGPSYGNLVEITFPDADCNVSSLLDLIACTTPCSGPVDADQVGGNVFNDANINGINDSESGQENVFVQVYDCLGNLVCETYTNASGDWSCDGLDDSNGGSFRVEYSTPLQRWLVPSFSGTDNLSAVQSIMLGTCGSVFAVTNPDCYCQDDPDLAVPCYINGDPAMAADSDDALVQFPSSSTGTGQPSLHPGSAPQIGATFGSVVQRSTGRIFTAAMLKRHSGLGTGGIDAIYEATEGIEDNAALWLDGVLNADISAAINPATSITAVPDNATRGLGAPTVPNHDAAVFPLIGKVGFGDMDISEDDETLYVVNLADRTLNAIDIASVDNGSPNIQTLAIPDPQCAGGFARPWGLVVRNGIVYIGVVCTGELYVFNPSNTAPMDIDSTTYLRAFVYAYPEGGTAIPNAPVLEFSLDYDGIDGNNDKGCAGASNAGCRWFTWIDEYIDLQSDPTNSPYESAFGSDVRIAPQPILSDINFDKEGFMILSFTDRNGHQIGWVNYTPDPTAMNTSTIRGVTGGDILLAAPNITQTSWTIESAGAAGGRMTAGTGTNQDGFGGPTGGQGPGGGEFFFSDNFSTVHSELSAGSAVFVPGEPDRIYAAIMDPVRVRTAGIRSYSLMDGTELSAFEVFGQDSDGMITSTFGKSGGLGDLSVVCNPLPIEIGNYVWVDMDIDGVQDGCELPLIGLNVSLFRNNSDGSVDSITTVQTDANGYYYFSSTDSISLMGSMEALVNPDSNYFVVFGTGGQYNTNIDRLILNDSVYELTDSNIGEGLNTDDNDSDATETSGIFAGLPTISLTAPSSGVDHSFDAGFVLIEPVVVGDTTFVDANANGLQDAGDLPLPGVIIRLFDADADTLITTDLYGNTITGMQITDANGFYLFDSLAPGNYYVTFDITSITDFEILDFTLPNVSLNAIDSLDSDADTLLTMNPDSARSGNSEPIPSGDTVLTLDAGVVCVLTVDAGANASVCRTNVAALSGSVEPAGIVTALWTTSGDGTFDDVSGDFLTTTSYTFGPDDIQNGFVTLTLTADGGTFCGMITDQITIEILNVDCGQFPWDGQD